PAQPDCRYRRTTFSRTAGRRERGWKVCRIGVMLVGRLVPKLEWVVSKECARISNVPSEAQQGMRSMCPHQESKRSATHTIFWHQCPTARVVKLVGWRTGEECLRAGHETIPAALSRKLFERADSYTFHR